MNGYTKCYTILHSAIKVYKLLVTCHNLDKSPGNYVVCKKPIPKIYVAYDTTFLKWQYCRKEKSLFVSRNMGWVGKGEAGGKCVK